MRSTNRPAIHYLLLYNRAVLKTSKTLMLQIKKILFPTDYSACAEQAFSQAAYLAERYDAELHVLHVTEPLMALQPLGFTEADIAKDLHLPVSDAMTEMQSAVKNTLINVEVPPVEGSVERAILAYAVQHRIDVIVMGTHGRRAVDRLLLGSVAGKVVRLAECPVITVGFEADSWDRRKQSNILVPVDFSDHASLALAYAAHLAVTYGVGLDVLHVIEESAFTAMYGFEPATVKPPELQEKVHQAMEQLVRRVCGDNVLYEIHAEMGHPAYTIVDFAERQGVGLIVIASHGLTGIKRLLLGSVAERVVHRAPCPVFTVKGFGKRLLDLSKQSEVTDTFSLTS